MVNTASCGSPELDAEVISSKILFSTRDKIMRDSLGMLQLTKHCSLVFLAAEK
jgi:hypothetical protein